MDYTFFRSALRLGRVLPRGEARLVTSALLAATLALGCGDSEEGTGDLAPWTSPSTLPNATADSGAGAPGEPAAVNTSDAGSDGSTTPAAGVSLDTPWCKVKKILDAKCVACHATPLLAGAPFPLLKYEDLSAPHPTKTGKKIYERVGVRVHFDKSMAEGLGMMPPGTQLPADQLALIDSWVAAGAPAGENPTCAPPAGTQTDAGAPVEEPWPPAECDAVYKVTSHAPSSLTQPFSVAPKEETHPQVTVPAPWGSEKVQAIAFRSITDNRTVLHHWILNGGGAFLTGWAPGEDGIKKMRPETGMDMPTGDLTLDMHYNSLQATKTETDASGVEICVVKEPKFRKHHVAVTMKLAALPNVPNNSVMLENAASCTVGGTQPITLLTASPHAHTLAVRMRFTVKKKNGQLITMHDMPFQFGEQKTYTLDPPVVVDPGDVINTSCFYTNMTGRTVTFGEDTGNEMCFNFASYYPAGELSCGFGLPGF